VGLNGSELLFGREQILECESHSSASSTLLGLIRFDVIINEHRASPLPREAGTTSSSFVAEERPRLFNREKGGDCDERIRS
jgi:hypothetical protein